MGTGVQIKDAWIPGCAGMTDNTMSQNLFVSQEIYLGHNTGIMGFVNFFVKYRRSQVKMIDAL
jgi:hypothetical protein